MGRIHEARRRAATKQRIDPLAVVPMPPAPEDVDFQALVDTAFSRESSDLQEPEAEVHPTSPEASHAAHASEAATSAPVVEAVVPFSALHRMDARLEAKIVIDGQTEPISREQYRRIGAVLHERQRSTGLSVLMVASAVAGEGRTLTAINLALTLSESYRKRVLLVDGDLRCPALHHAFGLDSSRGLGDALKPSSAEFVVSDISPTLAILAGGDPTSDPMADLTSDRMRLVIAESKKAFDWVVIDTPPVVLLPDAHLLASIVDGVVLVVRAESTPYALVTRAIESVGRPRVVGVVLNGATTNLRGLDDKYDRAVGSVTS